ncbi:MAG: excisionase family DNA-binding protein [Bryobacteraceae bacterium]
MDTSVKAFLGAGEVASRLCVSVRTIRLWAECSVIPAVKMGRQWRFRAIDIHRIEADGALDVFRQFRQQRHTNGK